METLAALSRRAPGESQPTATDGRAIGGGMSLNLRQRFRGVRRPHLIHRFVKAVSAGYNDCGDRRGKSKRAEVPDFSPTSSQTWVAPLLISGDGDRRHCVWQWSEPRDC